MPATNKSTISRDKNGYFRTTLPKPLGDAMGYANTEVGWRAPSGSSLIISKNPRDGLPTTTVVQNEQGYYRMRVPKALAAGHELGGVRVEWTVDSANALRAEVVDD